MKRRLPLWLYWAIYALLLVWFLACGLRLLRGSFWSPIALMVVLDWLMTRDTLLRYVLAAFLMIAIFGLMILAVLSELPIEQRPFIQTGAVLAALLSYQLLLWRVVLRRTAT